MAVKCPLSWQMSHFRVFLPHWVICSLHLSLMPATENPHISYNFPLPTASQMYSLVNTSRSHLVWGPFQMIQAQLQFYNAHFVNRNPYACWSCQLVQGWSGPTITFPPKPNTQRAPGRLSLPDSPGHIVSH